MRENLEKSTLRVVGLRQVLRAIREEKALKVYLADDAEENMRIQVLEAAEQKQVPLCKVNSMRALAHLCNVDVPASCAAVLTDAKNT